MIAITNNLKIFSGIVILATVGFFYYLSAALESQSHENMGWYALAFAVVLFVSGLVLGWKDPVRQSRADLGFQYHLYTFIIVNGIGIPWMFVDMGIHHGSIMHAVYQVGPWAIGLFAHYYFSSRSIKGMDKGDIFE